MTTETVPTPAELKRSLAKLERLNNAPEPDHDLRPGDILHASWGYEQTNATFFQVVALKGRTMVTVREIQGRHVEHPTDRLGAMAGRKVPVPGAFVEREEPQTRKVLSSYGGGKRTLRMESFMYAKPWDGKPAYYSSTH